jgi:hypothetical protein
MESYFYFTGYEIRCMETPQHEVSPCRKPYPLLAGTGPSGPTGRRVKQIIDLPNRARAPADSPPFRGRVRSQSRAGRFHPPKARSQLTFRPARGSKWRRKRLKRLDSDSRMAPRPLPFGGSQRGITLFHPTERQPSTGRTHWAAALFTIAFASIPVSAPY